MYRSIVYDKEVTIHKKTVCTTPSDKGEKVPLCVALNAIVKDNRQGRVQRGEECDRCRRFMQC